MADTGRAFEFACVQALFLHYAGTQDVAIIQTPQVITAESSLLEMSLATREKMTKAAEAAVRVINRLEPQLNSNRGRLSLTIQPDAAGIAGDVRDVLCIRDASGWEVGISCKHNHHAVKHSRLSATINFGNDWFGIPCSERYFDTVVPIFEELRELKATGALWRDMDDKAERYYIPILDAFMTELIRLDRDNPGVVPGRLIQYLIGRHDFYKVISEDSRRYTRIEAFNINGELNQNVGRNTSMARVPLLRLPNRIYDVGYKPGSDNTIQVVCNEGWEISMRIHNASSKVEPSLKFDINLISTPNSIYAQSEPWE